MIFVCILEPTSDPARKNPFAAIRAFQGAFSSDDPAHLVIKVNNAQAAAGAGGRLAQLREEAKRLGKRVTLIENFLSHEEVLQLFASCDVFVGLHRAEGLGLGLMEAMALGKPVVATGWSGNMSFMNHTNSCLVGYRLVPVHGSLDVYSQAFLKQEARWADPDLGEAQAWMKALAADASLRASIGRHAAVSMRQHCVEAERGVFIDELRAIWERPPFLCRSRVGKTESSLKILREARFNEHAGPIEKVRRKSLALADKHLLWRFRSK